MFWQGFLIGLFIGANVGLVVLGMLIAAKEDRPVFRGTATGENNGDVR
jgi:hypothetical protein